MSSVDEESMETWVEDLRGEVARLKAEVDLMRRIVVLPLEQTRDEVKALEPGNTAAACRAIDLWNMRSNTEAKCRENRKLRAENQSLREQGRAVEAENARLSEELRRLKGGIVD